MSNLFNLIDKAAKRRVRDERAIQHIYLRMKINRKILFEL